MPSGRRGQRGFTYLLVLLMVALIGLGLGTAGTLWRTEARRANEAELLFIGAQYRQAIQSYYTLDPALPRLPKSVADLLEDRRRPQPVRHLRRAYRDPLTGGDLLLIPAGPDDGIIGVMSRAPGRPLKRAGFQRDEQSFTDAETYAGWRFVFVPPAPTTPDRLQPEPSAAPQDPVLFGPERAPAVTPSAENLRATGSIRPPVR